MEYINTCKSHAFVSKAKLGTTEWKFLCIGESPGKPMGTYRPLWITIITIQGPFKKIIFIGVTLVNRIQGHFLFFKKLFKAELHIDGRKGLSDNNSRAEFQMLSKLSKDYMYILSISYAFRKNPRYL